MKNSSLVSLLSASAALTAAFGAPNDVAQLQVYPKNLARQHLGANLFHYNAPTQSYTPTEAAAAWLDDDITTGWPLLAGKQYYLLSLPSPELLTNFCLSTRPAAGTVTLYAGNEPAPPGAKTWTTLAHDIPLESINEKKLAHPFSREAKYLLIETDVADPGPVYSLYVYGDKPATVYNIQKREQPIDTHGIFGPYVNEERSFNVAGLYAQSYIDDANSSTGFVGWQKAIDDNPETGLTVPPSPDKPGVTLRYDGVQNITRLALLTDPGAKGKLDFFLTKRESATPAPAPVVGANVPASPAPAEAATTPPPVAEGALTPTVSMVLDGTTARTAVDLPATEADTMLVRWTPANGTDTVNIRELNAFGSENLANYATTMKPEAVAANGRDPSKDGKDAKSLPAVGEGPAPVGEGPQSGPFLPGSLGFPPNILVRNPMPPPVSP